MKYILLLLSATALRAQVPHIDYMMADEAKSQLQIHGIFSSDTTGFVTIENIKQTVRSWSDTLIICDLPDSGAGSGGHVAVTQMSGTSNARMLSIFVMGIRRDLYADDILLGTCEWYDVIWRLEIDNFSQQNFENSKISWGTYYDPKYSNKYQLLSGALSGSVKNSVLSFSEIAMLARPNAYSYYQIQNISFDSTGSIKGYSDDQNPGNATNEARDNIDIEILFPPSAKNGVTQSFQTPSDLIKIFSHIVSEDHLIFLEAEVPLGETTASLYSIDGRLLKQEKIFISSAGMYSFDASGINMRMGFLIVQTEKGIVTGKVLF